VDVLTLIDSMIPSKDLQRKKPRRLWHGRESRRLEEQDVHVLESVEVPVLEVVSKENALD
jgi:hypothetical protein